MIAELETWYCFTPEYLKKMADEGLNMLSSPVSHDSDPFNDIIMGKIGRNEASGRPARRFADFRWTTKLSCSRRRRVVAKAEWMPGRGEKGGNPRFVVTSLKPARADARTLYEQIYCACGEMENRIKECQLDLFADRTSAATMRANQLRLWFASMAYMLVTALRRIGLAGTDLATATCGSIRLKLLKIGALVTRSVRRIRVAMASSCPDAAAFRLAHARLCG